MLDSIVPDGVQVVAATQDVSLDTLWPGEWERVSAEPAARQGEYATVRDCARTAVGALGVAPGPILADSRGAPVWPDGIIGAMTHCRGYRAAAAARRGWLRSIGIDAEPAAALPERVLERISSKREQAWIAMLARKDASIPWDRILFSMKESMYKAWYPVATTGLGFHDVDLHLHDDGTCGVHVLVDQPDSLQPLTWQARWAVEDDLLATVVWLQQHPLHGGRW
ncbi:MAG: 4'-phosphopantetheinyl transferase superfamily protein [Propionibacteriaceae bacterium]|nr:4'-phosphopantetheinyl transferase superfamily protein [Propionibacteriaceae bacterium]